jgi:N-terminal acetyltransferase B complex non-catalytic subunit
VDTDIFPDYEDSQGYHVGALVMPNSIPTPSWLLTTHFVGERSRRLLFRETGYDSLDPFLDIYRKGGPQPSPTGHTPTEHTFKSYWTVIDNIVADIFEGETTGKLSVDVNCSTFDTLLNSIIAMRKAEEKLRLPITITTLRPEDEPTMFHENKFMASYGKFEICRAVIKLVDLLREKVLKGKTKHPLRARLPPNFDTRLRNEVEMAFNAVRDVAHSYINLLKTRGVAAIKAQVRWGVTGRYLERMLSDEDMEFYAGEYVESAMEAWKGVLKVKMDR